MTRCLLLQSANEESKQQIGPNSGVSLGDGGKGISE